MTVNDVWSAPGRTRTGPGRDRLDRRLECRGDNCGRDVECPRNRVRNAEGDRSSRPELENGAKRVRARIVRLRSRPRFRQIERCGRIDGIHLCRRLRLVDVPGHAAHQVRPADADGNPAGCESSPEVAVARSCDPPRGTRRAVRRWLPTNLRQPSSRRFRMGRRRSPRTREISAASPRGAGSGSERSTSAFATSTPPFDPLAVFPSSPKRVWAPTAVDAHTLPVASLRRNCFSRACLVRAPSSLRRTGRRRSHPAAL